ncbi:MAG: PLP-dependent lyase/thiolase [Patescibacteria group bacterium]
MNLILNVNQNFDDFCDRERHDLWRYAKLLGKLKNTSQIGSGQTEFTPLKKVGEWLVKREDCSITGSHKFRALAFQLSCLLAEKIDRAVLSSSGNAAIAAAKILPHCANLKLFTFLSRRTPPEKLAALEFSENFVPILSDRPLRMAKYATKHFKLKDLRPSQDRNAVVGFRSLGFEIFEQNPKIENIFSFATSFASVHGMAEAFDTLVKLGALAKAPRIFAVVSSGQLAGELSGRIVDKSLCRVDKKIVEWTRVDNSRQLVDTQILTGLSAGRQVDISDEEISAAQAKFNSVETSNEGFASLAAAEKIKPGGQTLVILTGRKWKDGKVDLTRFEKADNFAEVDRILTPHG